MTLTQWVSGIVLFCAVPGQGIADDRVWDDIDGFLDARGGGRLTHDPQQKDTSLGEIRLQLGTEQVLGEVTFNIVTDLVFDPVLAIYRPDLESGEGFIDQRQFNIVFSPTAMMDVKLGLQILTWGTGDLIFINDLFPKDFNALFIGRDDEYLKAPSDAIKLSLFTQAFNADLVYTPKFDADRFIDGQRISVFDRGLNTFRGQDDPLATEQPDRWFEDDELAIRLYRTFGNVESALYYYNGFWKSPAGRDVQTGEALFPTLQVWGGSLRSPLAGGIANLEIGYYRSHDDAASDPLNSNSEFRLLLGFEREIATEFTAAIQYYLERKLDYDDYLDSLPGNAIKDDENRSVFTVRLSKSMMRQDLTLSIFNVYSPSDKDGYLRLNIAYKLTDDIRLEGGLNYFHGDTPYTFFAQFENSGNIYGAVRYEF